MKKFYVLQFDTYELWDVKDDPDFKMPDQLTDDEFKEVATAYTIDELNAAIETGDVQLDDGQGDDHECHIRYI